VDHNTKPVPKERARKAEVPIEDMPAPKKPKIVHDEAHEEHAGFVDAGSSSQRRLSDDMICMLMRRIKNRRLDALLYESWIRIPSWTGPHWKAIIPKIDVSATERQACLGYLSMGRSNFRYRYAHKKRASSASKSAGAVISQGHGKTDKPVATRNPHSRKGVPVPAVVGLESPNRTVAKRVPLSDKATPVPAATRCKFKERKPKDRNHAVAETILHLEKDHGKRILGVPITGTPLRRSLLSSAVFTSEEDTAKGTIHTEVPVTPVEDKDI
jgi:hypothetical protein